MTWHVLSCFVPPPFFSSRCYISQYHAVFPQLFVFLWRHFLEVLMRKCFGMSGKPIIGILAICVDGETTVYELYMIWKNFTFHPIYFYDSYSCLQKITCMTKTPQLLSSFWQVWVVMAGCHLMLTQSSFLSLFHRILKYCLQDEKNIKFVLHLHLVFGSTKSGHLLFSHILFNITQICMPLFWSPPNPPQISGYCLKNKHIIKPKHLSKCQQSQQN